MEAPNVLELGHVTIKWDSRVEWPIAVNHKRLNGDDILITASKITYYYGSRPVGIVPARFSFDGASIPLIFRWVPGFKKIAWHLFATCIHDFACLYPDVISRPMGDGIFLSVLEALASQRCEEAKTKRQLALRMVQAWMMYAAVAGYTMYRAIRSGLAPKRAPADAANGGKK